MKAIARSLIVILVALIAVPALAVSYTLATAVQLLATTALIMGGTQHSLGPNDDQAYITTYFGQAVGNFITPGTGAPDDTYAVTYPAEFFPVFGLTTFDASVDDGRDNLGNCLDATAGNCTVNQSVGDHPPNTPPPVPSATEHFIVFGYSLSAVVASLVKNDLIGDGGTASALDGTEFFLVSNPMRPNGGILGRGFEGLTIPIIGITFYGPTQNSCVGEAACIPTADPNDPNVYPTIDVAQQYDFLGGDAPARPLNFLALANSLAAYAQLHGDVPTHSLDEEGIIDQGEYGDTHYYMIAADTLPLLQPLVTAGVPAAALAIPDAILRVWIEDAYIRDKSPGEHVQFELSPIGDPIGLIFNTLGAIPVGIDDTVEGFTAPGNRPLGTDPAGPFGVGGPNPDELATLDAARDGSPDPAITPQPQVGNNKLIRDQEADEIGNVTEEGDEAPDGAKPRPFERLRGPIGADRPRPLAGLRPNGEGPLKRIVKALTGQGSESGEDAEAKDEQPKAEDNAA